MTEETAALRRAPLRTIIVTSPEGTLSQFPHTRVCTYDRMAKTLRIVQLIDPTNMDIGADNSVYTNICRESLSAWMDTPPGTPAPKEATSVVAKD